MTTTKHPDPKPGSIMIRGQKVPVATADLEHSGLRFYTDNPRIYSLIHHDGREPSQEEIEELLLESEHVRQLMRDIAMNGGLIEPLIVRSGTYEVLEGNSRLAAYRGLSRKDPIAWGHVKCTLLPQDIEESLVFALLGQFHVKGKKAWQPYEQAGFLYRRCMNHKLDFKALGEEIGLKWKTVKHLVETYQFMAKHGEPPERWSYYDEYLKSTKIGRARENQPNLDAVIVSKINSQEIAKAVDVRDNLPHICMAPKILQKFVGGKLDFELACEQARDTGTDNAPFQKLKKFRMFIVEDSLEERLLAMEPGIRASCVFELDKIEGRVRTLRSKLKAK